MKRIILYLTAAILFFGIQVSCNKTKKSYTKAGEKIVETKLAQYKVYKNKSAGYQINLPLDWEYKKKKGNSMAIFAPFIDDNTYRESIDIVVKKSSFKQNKEKITSKPFDLEKYADKHFGDLQKSIFNLRSEASGSKTINKKKSRWNTFTDNTGKKDLRLVKYIIANNDMIYIITGTSQVKNFSNFGPLFNEIVESFVCD